MKYFYLIFTLLSLSFSHSLLAKPEPSIHNNESAFKRKSIILATHIEPPLAYLEGSILKGANIEVARLLARKLNLSLRFIQCPFARCLSLLKKGQADMMVGIKKTNKREIYLDYLNQPYTSRITPVRFYLRADSHLAITNYADLANKSIGVIRGATYFDRFDSDTSLNKIEVTTHKQLIDMFLKERFDTFLGREISIEQHVSPAIYNSKMKLSPYVYKKKNDSYIVISKQSSLDTLTQELSKTLDNVIASGEVDKIIRKYIHQHS